MRKYLAFSATAVIGFGLFAESAESSMKTSLGTVEQFKTAFNRDRGKVRLVALVSPT